MRGGDDETSGPPDWIPEDKLRTVSTRLVVGLCYLGCSVRIEGCRVSPR